MRRCRVMVIPWPGGVGAECLYPPLAPCQMAEGQATGLASRIWELIHWFIYSFIQLNIYLLTHFIPVTQIQRCLQSKGSESSYGGLTPRGGDGLSVSNPTQCPLLSPLQTDSEMPAGTGQGPWGEAGLRKGVPGLGVEGILDLFLSFCFPFLQPNINSCSWGRILAPEICLKLSTTGLLPVVTALLWCWEILAASLAFLLCLPVYNHHLVLIPTVVVFAKY